MAYLKYKIVRGDWAYWLNVEAPVSWVVAFLNRLVHKVICDFR